MELRLCAFADEASSDLFEQIRILKENNIFMLELRSIYGKNVFDFTKEEALKYSKILKENGIKVWSIGSPIGKVKISTDFDKYLAKVHSFFEICNIFECKRVRMFSFFEAFNDEEKVFKYLNLLVEEAYKFGITLCHENEKDVYGDNVSRVLKIKENVPGLKFIFDPANYIQVGQNIDEAIGKCLSFTSYFHIKDCLKSGEVVPSGLGDANIKKMLSLIDFDTTLTLEPHLKIFDAYFKIDNSELKNKYVYKDNETAFKEACAHLKKLLLELNFKETNGGFTK
ncbi:MAG: sugar phosphate isomerase/epimerase [Bacilli bacterium]|nr:sugar phosphate isomerase/epimerase [Bacilli bacterium]